MKKTIIWTVSGVSTLVVLWVAITAAMVGSEASQVDSMMKSAIAQHEAVSTVSHKIAMLGFTMRPDGTTADPKLADLSGRGSDHWAVIYRTWLTLTVNSGPDGTVHGYHLDRAGSIF